MPFVFPSKKILDIERLALACVEGANPLVDLRAQVTQFLDVRQQPAANLFLIRVGQAGDFRHGYFECPDHFAIISHRRACLHPGDSWRARRGFEAPYIQIS
jgi:hypothetical protein